MIKVTDASFELFDLGAGPMDGTELAEESKAVRRIRLGKDGRSEYDRVFLVRNFRSFGKDADGFLEISRFVILPHNR